VLDSGKWSTLHRACFTNGKEPRYSVHRGLGGSLKLSGRYGEETKPLPLPVLHVTHFCAFAAIVPAVFRIPTRPVLCTFRNYKLRAMIVYDLNYLHDIFPGCYPCITVGLYVIQIQQMNVIFPTYVRCGLYIYRSLNVRVAIFRGHPF